MRSIKKSAKWISYIYNFISYITTWYMASSLWDNFFPVIDLNNSEIFITCSDDLLSFVTNWNFGISPFVPDQPTAYKSTDAISDTGCETVFLIRVASCSFLKQYDVQKIDIATEKSVMNLVCPNSHKILALS